MVCQSNESYEREVINTQTLVSHRVAGLLASISQCTCIFEHFRAVIRRGLPLVFFDRVVNELEVSKVMVDDAAGAYAATTHLIDRGYQRIAHLAGAPHINIGEQRLQGYRQALEDHGIPFDNRRIIIGGFKKADGETGLARLLALDPRPDAIFAVNDPVAIGAYVELKRRGLRIPKDMALVGFSNNPIAGFLDPGLTSIEQHAFDIGETAATLLLAQIDADDESFVPTIKTLSPELIVRSSS